MTEMCVYTDNNKKESVCVERKSEKYDIYVSQNRSIFEDSVWPMKS